MFHQDKIFCTEKKSIPSIQLQSRPFVLICPTNQIKKKWNTDRKTKWHLKQYWQCDNNSCIFKIDTYLFPTHRIKTVVPHFHQYITLNRKMSTTEKFLAKNATCLDLQFYISDLYGGLKLLSVFPYGFFLLYQQGGLFFLFLQSENKQIRIFLRWTTCRVKLKEVRDTLEIFGSHFFSRTNLSSNSLFSASSCCVFLSISLKLSWRECVAIERLSFSWESFNVSLSRLLKSSTIFRFSVSKS